MSKVKALFLSLFSLMLLSNVSANLDLAKSELHEFVNALSSEALREGGNDTDTKLSLLSDFDFLLNDVVEELQKEENADIRDEFLKTLSPVSNVKSFKDHHTRKLKYSVEKFNKHFDDVLDDDITRGLSEKPELFEKIKKLNLYLYEILLDGKKLNTSNLDKLLDFIYHRPAFFAKNHKKLTITASIVLAIVTASIASYLIYKFYYKNKEKEPEEIKKLEVPLMPESDERTEEEGESKNTPANGSEKKEPSILEEDGEEITPADGSEKQEVEEPAGTDAEEKEETGAENVPADGSEKQEVEEPAGTDAEEKEETEAENVPADGSEKQEVEEPAGTDAEEKEETGAENVPADGSEKQEVEEPAGTDAEEKEETGAENVPADGSEKQEVEEPAGTDAEEKEETEAENVPADGSEKQEVEEPAGTDAEEKEETGAENVPADGSEKQEVEEPAGTDAEEKEETGAENVPADGSEKQEVEESVGTDAEEKEETEAENSQENQATVVEEEDNFVSEGDDLTGDSDDNVGEEVGDKVEEGEIEVERPDNPDTLTRNTEDDLVDLLNEGENKEPGELNVKKEKSVPFGTMRKLPDPIDGFEGDENENKINEDDEGQKELQELVEKEKERREAASNKENPDVINDNKEMHAIRSQEAEAAKDQLKAFIAKEEQGETKTDSEETDKQENAPVANEKEKEVDNLNDREIKELDEMLNKSSEDEKKKSE